MFNFSRVRPWWLRLALLVLVGSPMFTGGVLHARLHIEHSYQDLAWWSAYILFIWLIILLCVGLERFLQWLSVATVFGLTIVVLGVILRRLHFWEFIQRLLSLSAPANSAPAGQDELDLIFRLLMIMVSLPFVLFAISSFPAGNLLQKLSIRSTERKNKFAVHCALFLRVFQHVLEVTTTTLTAWREENPEMILPRFRDDWRGSAFGRIRFLGWARTSVWTWCLTLTLQTLLIVPIVVKDFKRLLPKV